MEKKTSGLTALKNLTAELNQRDEALKQSNDFLENIIESSSDSIVVTDADENLIRVNRAFRDTFRYVAAVRGKPIKMFIPNKPGIYKTALNNEVTITEDLISSRDKVVASLYEVGKIINWETFMQRVDKKLIPVEVNIAALYEQDGTYGGAVSIIRDITDRKKHQKELEQREKYFRSLIENSLDIILLIDFNMIIKYVSPSVAVITDWKVGEFIDKSWLSFIHKDDIPSVKTLLQEAITEPNKVIPFGLRTLGKNGDVRLTEGKIKKMNGDTEIEGCVVNCRDITERIEEVDFKT